MNQHQGFILGMRKPNQIKETANQGKGVIMITHDIHSALDIADKIAVFYAGSTLRSSSCFGF